jgi:isocitrate dehydrogenase kinase/phosphatase
VKQGVESRERFARAILNGFESYFAEFQNITLAARSRFENADWLGIRHASIQRIDLYKAKTKQVYEYLELIAGQDLHDFDFWREAKRIYAQLIILRSPRRSSILSIARYLDIEKFAMNSHLCSRPMVICRGQM